MIPNKNHNCISIPNQLHESEHHKTKMLKAEEKENAWDLNLNFNDNNIFGRSYSLSIISIEKISLYDFNDIVDSLFRFFVLRWTFTMWLYGNAKCQQEPKINSEFPLIALHGNVKLLAQKKGDDHTATVEPDWSAWINLNREKNLEMKYIRAFKLLCTL